MELRVPILYIGQNLLFYTKTYYIICLINAYLLKSIQIGESNMSLLFEIENLFVSIDNKEIIKNLNLTVKEGEIHVIMGPNGAGKSTLANVIMGHPKYKITAGKMMINKELINDLEPAERSKKGIFLAMQYSQEVNGVTTSEFLRTALNAHNKNINLFRFAEKLENLINDLNMPNDLASRSLNVGFSGGERKKNEILQMKFLEPNLVILDEIDSGLDVESLKMVGENIMEEFKNEK